MSVRTLAFTEGGINSAFLFTENKGTMHDRAVAEWTPVGLEATRLAGIRSPLDNVVSRADNGPPVWNTPIINSRQAAEGSPRP